ncbi:MAG: Crp/Fnr family transcriptional regulator [Acidobacteria bacterium]|nr:MAG: Crp/Fnr family transcriptional regulator [Acidobacteriota bacterium]REJ99036.1 MAG: Crp/Fnr family transcriptional regulator [Acidobacteriota bacterium]REK16243.1 MAG: Crp/Fnr family transcriptional regulator [Acidobacteriota bacterium]REK43924.1 MAG: Crp/Fnr family transcriptional regulator [Acidobacteriota bacterium]
MKKLDGFEVQHKCEECDHRSEGFFCDMQISSLRVIESLKITNAYPKGATLFMEGQSSNGVFILCQGKVKLSTSSKDGKIIILHIAEAGEVLGLNSAVSGHNHTATAEAIEPCQVNYIRNDDFLEFLRVNNEACFSALRQLSNDYKTAYLQICSLGLSNSVADKLSKLFLGWCRAAAEEGESVRLKMSYTHEEIAEMIGTSRETVTRLLKVFRERDLISFEGSELIIHDTERLSADIDLPE